MCGLVGVGGPRGREVVAELVGTLRHRGPDDEATWSDDHLTLGHRRLAVIGLDPEGRQPRVSRSGESVLIFNGEIYNYLELADRLEASGRRPDRRFDTDVLLEALEAWGVDALPRLNGMFAFAWYRPRSRRILLARDRWGQKPLFWGRPRLPDGSSALVFGSELRLFTRLPGGPPPPDPLGIARYLAYDGMPADRTVYAGVEKVPAANWIELDPEGDVTRRGSYWSWDHDIARIDPEAALDRLESLLDRSLSLRLRSDVPVGLFLSGGIDSALLASTWRRVAPDATIETFTVGFQEPSYDESGPARALAERIGARHHEVVLGRAELAEEVDRIWGHLSEPLADPSIIPTSILYRHARERVTVGIAGDGGDELTAGYDPFRAWGPAAFLQRVLGRRLGAGLVSGFERLLPVDDRNMSLRFKVHHFAQGLAHPPEERIQAWMAPFPPHRALAVMDPDLAAAVDEEEILEPTRRAFRALEHRGVLAAQIHVWIKTYLEASILTKVDRASMLHSLEVRSPFLDPELAAFLSTLPDSLLHSGRRGKIILRKLARRRFGPEVARRPKKGFGVPQGRWLKSELGPRMEDCLDRASRTGGWFRVEEIERLWSEHLDGRGEHRRALWAFLFSFPFQAGGRS